MEYRSADVTPVLHCRYAHQPLRNTDRGGFALTISFSSRRRTSFASMLAFGSSFMSASIDVHASNPISWDIERKHFFYFFFARISADGIHDAKPASGAAPRTRRRTSRQAAGLDASRRRTALLPSGSVEV